jgi:hypothetical protein
MAVRMQSASEELSRRMVPLLFLDVGDLNANRARASPVLCGDGLQKLG